jgi:hypothetical protein
MGSGSRSTAETDARETHTRIATGVLTLAV